MAEPEASAWDFARPGARRSLLLCALGALVGLALAGYALFTAAGTRVLGVPPEDVATVNGTPLLMSDYLAQLRSLHDVSLSEATPAQKREVLEAMIREELYVQRGVELGLPTEDTETRTALVNAVEALVASDALTGNPADTELQRFFARNAARYASDGRMALAELAAPDSAQAAAAVSALRGGMAIAEAARRFGLRTTGKVNDGVEFYFAARIHLGPAAFAVARAMRDGQVSDPLPQPGGPVILVMHHNAVPVPQSFAMVRPRVANDYMDGDIARLQAANARFLRRRADIQIAAALR